MSDTPLQQKLDALIAQRPLADPTTAALMGALSALSRAAGALLPLAYSLEPSLSGEQRERVALAQDAVRREMTVAVDAVRAAAKVLHDKSSPSKES